MVGGYKVTTNISTKSALQIGVSPAPRRTPSETQRVTNLVSSKIGANASKFIFAVKLGLRLALGDGGSVYTKRADC